jgi:hypothetical protein
MFREILAAGTAAYADLKNNGGMGSLYRSQHEVFVFKSGRAPHINNIELGKHGRPENWRHLGP